MRNENRHGNDEYLDLVSTSDQVIGNIPRSQAYKEGASNFRVVNGFIRNSGGKLWIPKRAADKRIFPNSLDFSIGEHVESGETYEAALIRGVREELGLPIDTVPHIELGRLNPQDHQVSAFMTVYEISLDTAPPYPPSEYSDAFWLSPEELRERIKRGERAKSDLLPVLDHFYK